MRLTARKKRKILVLTELALALALGVYLFLINAVFVARDVRVEGNAAIDADAIIRAAQLPLGKPMRFVSEEKTREALESGGLVELVSLEKRFPDEIVLNVRERSRDAVTAYAGVVLTLERDGTAIERLDAVPESDAVYVTGLSISAYRLGQVVSAPEAQLRAMTETLAALYDNAATQYVSELNVSDPNAIYLYTRTGMRVDLGNSEGMGDKVIWMTGALRDLESRGETGGRLDVSSGDKADYSAG